jgi:hypothetical protein
MNNRQRIPPIYTGISDQMTDAEYWAEIGDPTESEISEYP